MKSNKALLTLFFFNGIFVFAAGILGPLYSLFVAEVTHDIGSVTSLWAIYMVVATVGTAVVARFGDGVKEKEYMLLLGYLFRIVGWGAYIFASNFQHLLIIQVVLGLGEAVGTPAFDSIIACHLDRGKQVKEYSTWKVVNNLVIALGTLIGGYIATNYGFTILFVTMSLLAFISFVGILLKPRKLL